MNFLNNQKALWENTTKLSDIVPRAGEFDAYEISNKATYTGVRPGAMNWSGWRKETLWYAPAAKAIIKLKSEQSKLRSDTPSFTIWELQTYTLH